MQTAISTDDTIDTPDAPRRAVRRGLIACIFAVVLAGAVYVPALWNPFIADDYRLIVENRSLVDLTNVHALLFWDVARPVVNLSYAIDRNVWGMAPFGFHLTNVVLHAMNVALFALLTWRAAEDRHHDVAAIDHHYGRPPLKEFKTGSWI